MQKKKKYHTVQQKWHYMKDHYLKTSRFFCLAQRIAYFPLVLKHDTWTYYCWNERLKYNSSRGWALCTVHHLGSRFPTQESRECVSSSSAFTPTPSFLLTCILRIISWGSGGRATVTHTCSHHHTRSHCHSHVFPRVTHTRSLSLTHIPTITTHTFPLSLTQVPTVTQIPTVTRVPPCHSHTFLAPAAAKHSSTPAAETFKEWVRGWQISVSMCLK